MNIEDNLNIYFRELRDYITKQRQKQLQVMLSLALVLVFTLYTMGNLQAQIKIHIENPSQQIYYLQQIKGDRLITVDSLLAKYNYLDFSWKNDYQHRMFRVYDGKKAKSILIWN